MNRSARRRPRTWLLFDAALLIPALWQMLTLARIFRARLTYPMDIGWLEGAILYHAYRLVHGQPIYGPPSQGFLPIGYPPLYPAVVGMVGWLLGLDYWTGRAVSIACFVVGCGVLAREVWRAVELIEDAVPITILAVASIAASFPLVAGFYDVVRNDSMAIALVIVAAGILSHAKLRPRRILMAAVTLTASMYAKQTGVFFAAWLCVFVFFSNRRMGILLCLTTAAASLLVLAVLQYATHGWFWTWVTLMGKHPVVPVRLISGSVATLRFAPFLPILPLLVEHLRRRRWLSRRSVLWFGMLVAAVPAALLPHIKIGGDWNNLIPMVFLAGPVAFLLCADLLKGIGRGHRSRRALVAHATVVGLGSVFLAVHSYAPAAYVPSADVWARTAAFNEFVRDLPGGVVIASHPFLAVRNGHTVPQFHIAAYVDARLAGLAGLDVVGYVLSTGAQWVILDGDLNFVEPELRTAYGNPRRIDPAISTLDGHHRPRWLLHRLPPPA